MKFNNILESIGNTGHVRLKRLFPSSFEIWMKLENNNPGGSIKDRIALSMIEDAEEKGTLKPGGIIIEPTSGNTGIGLAMVGAVKGYQVLLVMPESMSIERRRLMAAYGAKFELTPREQGMAGAINRARELIAEFPHSWMPSQFDNPANPDAHRNFTAREILTDFPDGLDYLFAGVGTGGHLTGCADLLKKHFSNLKVFAIEPEKSSVLSGGEPGGHTIQGIGAGFIPDNLKAELYDGVIPVSEKEAENFVKKCARTEGILVGISTGAVLAAVSKKLPEIPEGSIILNFCYDTGERYLSVRGLFELS